MRLTTRVEAIRLPLVSALPTGHGAIRHRTGLLVGLGDAEQTGWGEASPLPGWSAHSLTDTEHALRGVLADVADDGDVAAAVAALHGYPHARAALTGAWADLRARRDGVPLALALSARWRPEVELNALLAQAEVEQLERSAVAAMEQGFGTLKLKVGVAEPDVDVERVRAVRRIAPGAVLRLDANKAWDRGTATNVLRRVADFEIAWCEEPTPSLDDFASIESESGVRIAIDESAVTETDVRRALVSGLSVVVLKPQAIGGPDRAAGMSRLVAASGGTVVVTSFLDSAVGVAHALHVASAHGSPVAHGVATTHLLAADVGPGPVVDAGRARVPAAPGIGFDPELPPRAPVTERRA